MGAEWLIRAEREAEEHVGRLVELLQLEPGDVVCDLGCGNGAISIPMARAVGAEGTVHGVDIQQPMLELLGQRAIAAGVENINPVLGRDASFDVPAASCDLVLMVDVYHELSEPAEMLDSIREVLAEKGRVCLVEYRLEDPRVPIKLLHRMSRAQVVRELAESGYTWVAGADELPRQHVDFFEAGLFDEDAGPAKREAAICEEFVRGWLRALAQEPRLDERVSVVAPYYSDSLVVVEGSSRAATTPEEQALAWRERMSDPDTPLDSSRVSIQVLETSAGTAPLVKLAFEGLGQVTLELRRDAERALHIIEERVESQDR